MASARSLGLHTPSALSYLVAESLLPPDPSPNLYSWETYTDGGSEEELLCTRTCVVWSRGRIVRKLFSFDVEQESVHHAVLTWFPAHEDAATPGPSLGIFLGEGDHAQKRLRLTQDSFDPGRRKGTSGQEESARALVVF